MSGKSSAASRSPRLRASKAALRTFPAPLEATRSLHHWRDSMEILNGIHKNLQGLTPEPIQASNTGAGAAAETESVTGLNPESAMAGCRRRSYESQPAGGTGNPSATGV
jgi:hypothetical protein